MNSVRDAEQTYRSAVTEVAEWEGLVARYNDDLAHVQARLQQAQDILQQRRKAIETAKELLARATEAQTVEARLRAAQEAKQTAMRQAADRAAQAAAELTRAQEAKITADLAVAESLQG